MNPQAAPSPPAAEPRVVFGNTVDGMMHQALGERLTPALRSRLKAAGLDLELPLQSGYPDEDWKRWAAVAAEETFPGLEVSERYRQLGRTVVQGIRATLIGRAVAAVLQLIGPLRALGRMDRNFRNSDNFSHATLTEQGPQEVLLRVNEVMDQPTYMQGVLEALVEIAGGQQTQVEIAEVALPAATYRIRWR